MAKTMTLLNAMLIEILKKYPDADIVFYGYDDGLLSDILISDDGKFQTIMITDNIYEIYQEEFIDEDARKDTVVYSSEANYIGFTYDEFDKRYVHCN